MSRKEGQLEFASVWGRPQTTRAMEDNRKTSKETREILLPWFRSLLSLPCPICPWYIYIFSSIHLSSNLKGERQQLLWQGLFGTEFKLHHFCYRWTLWTVRQERPRVRPAACSERMALADLWGPQSCKHLTIRMHPWGHWGTLGNLLETVQHRGKSRIMKGLGRAMKNGQWSRGTEK